jgi:alkanesulfonate monooxygenase SsuD/methylene tetrahydromethanopterin reductase-like flavin-dependent oxidoreductase (luciferase family)
MRIGLHLTHYVPAAVTPRLPLILRDLAAHAEAAGLHSLWLMDQLEPRFGPREDPMLEPYSTLAWIVARTDHLQLGVLVSPPNIRDPRLQHAPRKRSTCSQAHARGSE